MADTSRDMGDRNELGSSSSSSTKRDRDEVSIFGVEVRPIKDTASNDPIGYELESGWETLFNQESPFRRSVKWCPRCQERTQTIDSRVPDKGLLRRRRRCKSCKFSFTTYEIDAAVVLRMIKIDRFREALKQTLQEL